MTVSTTDSQIDYSSGGPSFPIPFKFLRDEDIRPVLTLADGSQVTLVQNVQYTLTGAGNENGGTLTSAYAQTALATAGTLLRVSRVMAPTQETDLRNQGRYFAETHESAFDKLTMLVQQSLTGVANALSLNSLKNRWDFRGLRGVNAGNPIDPQDVTTKSYVDSSNAAQDTRIDSLSAGLPGTNYAFPWSTTTTTGTKTLTPGFEFSSAVLYINGIAQTYGKAFAVAGNQIILAEAIPAGSEVYAILGQNVVPTGPLDPTVIGNLMPADMLTGSELLPIIQGGESRRSTLELFKQYVRTGPAQVSVKAYGAIGDNGPQDLALCQQAVNDVSSTTGGIVLFPPGNFDVTGLKVPGNVYLLGAGVGATFLNFTGGPGIDGLEFTYKSTSYNWGGFGYLTIYNRGTFGGRGVFTPADTNAFTRSQRWCFNDFAVRGVSGWASNMVVGDCASGCATGFFMQGQYVAQNADAGQPVDVGILMKGARGVVNFDVTAYKVRGVRTAIQASDFAEGFSIHAGEIVGSWEGIVCDSNPSKPGGFIYNNHMNCAYRGIRMERRRHITIGTNQYYRDASFFAHGLGWKAVDAASCSGIVTGTIQTRPGVGFVDGNVGVSLTDSSDCQIASISGAEAGTLNTALQITATAATLSGGVSLGGISAETASTWVEFNGPVNDFKLADNVNERGTASTTPIVFNGTGAEKSSIKLPKTSTAIPEYQVFPNRNAALSKDIKARAHAPEFKESLVAGSGAYAVSYYFDTLSAVNGDTFKMKLVQIGGSNSTLNLYSGASTGSPSLLISLAAAAAGTNQVRLFTVKFRDTVWELDGNVTSLT